MKPCYETIWAYLVRCFLDGQLVVTQNCATRERAEELMAEWNALGAGRTCEREQIAVERRLR